MLLFLEKLRPFMAWLIQTSGQTAVLILLVLFAQWLFRKQISPRWRYNLWLLVLLRMMMPALPESSLSIFNLTKAFPTAHPMLVTTSPAMPRASGQTDLQSTVAVTDREGDGNPGSLPSRGDFVLCASDRLPPR
ncbi:MAG: hypothetical protein HY360_18505 [Verrucomicrobia bacterium]|nr:hypothetical protein [Verrucomicrobiota bacterium]